jgi:pantothenate kinase
VRTVEDLYLPMSEVVKLSPELRAARRAELDKAFEIRHQHAARARAAYLSGRRARRRRDFADPPPDNRQYATIETTIFRDHRMSKTEAAALTMMVARAGTSGYVDITHRQLGEAINRQRSTSKRVILNLKDKGYVRVEILRHPNGRAKCLRIRPTAKAWPYWHPHRQTFGYGSIFAPTITTSSKEDSVDGKKPQNRGPKRPPMARRREPDG